MTTNEAAELIAKVHEFRPSVTWFSRLLKCRDCPPYFRIGVMAIFFREQAEDFFGSPNLVVRMRRLR